MLRVHNVHKTFTLEKGEVRAVHEVSFELKKGEFFTLLGPSGSGKSTFLRCVAGLEKPERGEIRIGDQTVYSSEQGINLPPNQRPLGMVFQSYAIWPHMTVFQNVVFPLRYIKGRQSNKHQREAVAEVLEMVGLKGFENRPAPQLSGGQQQRVALARALVGNPQLLLLDEPLSNLDAKLREDMRHEIRKLTHSLNTTTLYVTHDQVEALTMSDRVGVIMAGAILDIAAPQDLYLRPRAVPVAQFIGTTNMFVGTVLECKDGKGKVDTEIGRMDVVLSANIKEADKVSVMIRPESIACHQESEGLPNTFSGLVEEVLFTGSHIAIRIRVQQKRIRAMLMVKEWLREGQTIYIHLPPESCIAMK